LIVAAEELEAEELVVAGDEALDLVEDGEGIEGAGFGLHVVGGHPHAVAIGFAGLRAAGLAEVGAEAFAEGDEGFDVVAHVAGETNDELEVGAGACLVGGFGDELEVAVAVGDGAGFLVEVGGGEDYVG
jgi:hypothetical protein